MNNPTFVLTLDLVCCLLSCVFLWSTLIVLLGLLKSPRRHPAAQRKMRFAVLICARNEEAVIRMPVKSIAMSRMIRNEGSTEPRVAATRPLMPRIL